MKVKDGIIGLIVGDALGVPVEFSTKSERDADPVCEMREYGTYGQPKGTWSDDSSMTIATVASITHKRGVDYDSIMDEFICWLYEDAYTNSDEGTFDIETQQELRLKGIEAVLLHLRPEEKVSVTTETDLL